MTIRLGLPLIALAAVLSWGCDGGTSGQVAAPRLEDLDGAFEYRAFDADGQLLLVGSVTLEVRGDSSITGTWEIGWAPGADRTTVVGPQVGTGTLAGSVGAEHTWIDLNPGWADNNVFLLASTADHGALAGQWQHSTFIGPVAEGRFELRPPA
jgi:hypothetical protein